MRLLAPNQTYYAMPSSIPEVTSGSLGVGLIDAIIPMSGMMVTVPNKNAGANLIAPFINSSTSPTSTFGKWGRAQVYNGTSHALRSSAPIGLKSVAEITMMLLFTPTAAAATTYSFGYGSSGSTTPFIGIGNGNTANWFDWRIRDDANVNKQLGASNAGVSTALYGVNIPSLAILRRSTTLNILDAYINGTQVDTRAPASQGTITLDRTTVGGLTRSSGFGLAQAGSSFLAATWNRALTLSEIETLSRNPWAIFETQPRPIVIGTAAAVASASMLYQPAAAFNHMMVR